MHIQPCSWAFHLDSVPGPNAWLQINVGLVRKLFSLNILDFFVAHPGWYVECNGKHLALWRRKTIVRGIGRPLFLAEALEVRKILVETPARARTIIISAGRPSTDPLLVPARLGGTVLGLFAGFLGSGIVFSYFFFFGDQLGGWFHLVFFFMLSGPVLGAMLGNRFVSPTVLWWLRRRQTREQRAVAASPWRQPPGSTALIQAEDDQPRSVDPGHEPPDAAAV